MTNEDVDNLEWEADEIDFLTLEDVYEIHAEGLRRFTPTEPAGVRDPGLLESAVERPKVTWGGEFLYSSLAEMAAAYLYGLAQNHAFENGNKRVGFAATSFFLRINGYRLTLSQNEAVELTMNVVNGIWDQEKAAEVLLNGMELL
ncbi:MAG: type II toxin-antitoxin system death-on-curing family toxin [Capsulimonadales bacterium]|nr:type II toxin-antitoxin system death-on-curing family toxin [Capsulimonadales bacterium]